MVLCGFSILCYPLGLRAIAYSPAVLGLICPLFFMFSNLIPKPRNLVSNAMQLDDVFLNSRGATCGTRMPGGRMLRHAGGWMSWMGPNVRNCSDIRTSCGFIPAKSHRLSSSGLYVVDGPNSIVCICLRLLFASVRHLFLHLFVTCCDFISGAGIGFGVFCL